MTMCRDAFENALNIVSFPPQQRQAIELVRQKILLSSALSRAALEDCRSLADPQGSTVLSANGKMLEKELGELVGLYPAVILLSRVPWLTAEYKRLHIEQQILSDTLSDIPVWIANGQRKTGRMALLEYTWLTNHLRMRLFRLGRLEYIYTKSRVPAYFYRRRQDGRVAVLAQEGMRYDVQGRLTEAADGAVTTLRRDEGGISGHPINLLGRIQPETVELPLKEWSLALFPGAPVLDVHIPEDNGLAPDLVEASLRRAPAFYYDTFGINDARAFTCGSWLMAPALGEIVPGSNIAAFQSLFRIAPYTMRDNQVFERVYGHPFIGWESMPQQTRLQRGVRDWYLAGGECRQMQGVILLDGAYDGKEKP